MTRGERNALIAGAAVSATMLYLFTRPRGKTAYMDTRPFDSPDIPGSGRCMNRDLLRMLLELERRTGYPVFQSINSGARSPAHNHKVGGVGNSSHLMPVCRAVDIHVPDTRTRDMLVRAARAVGFRRIGIGRTFIHLDNDPQKKQFVAWGYPKGTPPPYRVFA